MPYRIVYTSLIAFLAVLPLALAEPRPDFSGAWQLNAEKSTGIPPGMTQVMSVKQSGERIEVEVKLGGPEGERTVTDLYILNGKEAEFTPAVMGGGTAKQGKRVSNWRADGAGFEATEEAMIEGSEGTDKVAGKRTWRLSPDGKELTIEIDLRGDMGEIKSKRVFLKK